MPPTRGRIVGLIGLMGLDENLVKSWNRILTGKCVVFSVITALYEFEILQTM